MVEYIGDPGTGCSSGCPSNGQGGGVPGLVAAEGHHGGGGTMPARHRCPRRKEPRRRTGAGMLARGDRYRVDGGSGGERGWGRARGWGGASWASCTSLGGVHCGIVSYIKEGFLRRPPSIDHPTIGVDWPYRGASSRSIVNRCRSSGLDCFPLRSSCPHGRIIP